MQSHFIIAGERFPLVTETLDLAGTPVNLATVPYSPAELDRIAGLRGLKERAWPYWLEDWPATYALAEVLTKEDPADWPGPVLDLGCGSGVLAAFLRLRFGIEPFSCDFNADACRMAALNADGNGDGPAKGRVFCADFRSFPARPLADRPLPDRAVFGLVLAGEMLYARENQAPILDFLSRHLAPGGQALLADPGRSAAEGFREAALELDFRVETRLLPLPRHGKTVQVFRLRRALR
jgi:SAM-dependent methyltransferase